MGRPSKRDSDGLATGDAAYQRAIDLIYERGYHGTSLRDIAKAVGVQMSTLYYYYPSKQGLLSTIMGDTTQELIDAVRSAIDGVSDPRERLYRAVHAHVMFHAKRLKEAMIADTELRSLEPENREQIVALRDEHEHIFRGLLEEGRRTGALQVPHPALAARALLAAITDVSRWYRPSGSMTLEQIATEYCDLFLNGVGSGARPGVAPTAS